MRRGSVLSVFTLVGTVIGAGIFALPAAFARMGLWSATVWFWVLAALVCLTHALFVDVVLAVPGTHRLPGYVRSILGKRWGKFAAVTHFFQLYGAHVVYLLLGSTFLGALLAQAGWMPPPWLAMAALCAAVALGLLGGLRRFAAIETVATLGMLALFAAATATAFAQPSPLTRFVPQGSWAFFGLVLFALSGLPVVGEVVDLCGRKRVPARRAVLVGSVLAAFVTWGFAVAFAQAGGTRLTADPASLLGVLPAWGRVALPLMGLLAILTSYLSTAEDLQASWRHDGHLAVRPALVAALVPSLALALLFGKGFAVLAAVLGTVCGGANGVLVGMLRVAVAERRREALLVAGGLAAVFFYAFGMSGQLMAWLLS